MAENVDDDESLMDLRSRAADVNVQVVKSPAKLLDDIVGFVSHGKPIPSEQVTLLDTVLQTHQARIDLARVGINDYQLNHLTRIARMLDTVSDNLFTEFDGNLLLTAQLTPDEVVSLLKILLAEKNALVGHLTGKGQQQLVSSPENMRQLPQNTALPTSEGGMSADERKGVRDLLEAMLSKRRGAGAVDATVLIAEPASEDA